MTWIAIFNDRSALDSRSRLTELNEGAEGTEPMQRRRPIAIDLFCGAGGLSLGLRAAGFNLVFAVDDDPVAVRTYRANLGDHVVEASISDLAVEDILARTGLHIG